MARMFEILRTAMPGAGDTLKIECGACKHRATWSRRRAFDTFGEGAAPYDVGKGLVCSRCRETRNLRVWV
ncbi:MAG TPA: hypothetical protein PLO65_16695 [Caulobacter sp.]|nr:hypothetical protein [Caulobacter sp.]